YGPGDKTFPSLLECLSAKAALPIEKGELEGVPNLIFKNKNEIIKTKKDELYDQDALPSFPYEKLNSFYPIKKYLGKTFLGNRTIAYHSSIGCPFKCAFCGIVPIYEARW